MDRRLDRRYHLNLEATVADVAAPDRVASGRIVDVSQSGISAELSLRFAAGTTVKVQIGDCALFGHVTYCAAAKSFRTGIEVVRMLMAESDRFRFNAILSETIPATPERKFEIYRLSVVRSMPESDLKNAHLHAIMHTLGRLDDVRTGELNRPASSGANSSTTTMERLWPREK